MKKTIKIFTLASVVFFMVSCKNTTEKKPIENQPQQSEEQHHTEVEILKLNNGNLWEANSETTDGINAMIQLMNNFSETESPEAYATLKQELETEFKTIVEKCSMTGEAHDQLHVFIVPMRDLFNGLTISDIENSKENFNKLNAHLQEYKNYFE